MEGDVCGTGRADGGMRDREGVEVLVCRTKGPEKRQERALHCAMSSLTAPLSSPRTSVPPTASPSLSLEHNNQTPTHTTVRPPPYVAHLVGIVIRQAATPIPAGDRLHLPVQNRGAVPPVAVQERLSPVALVGAAREERHEAVAQVRERRYAGPL